MWISYGRDDGCHKNSVHLPSLTSILPSLQRAHADFNVKENLNVCFQNSRKRIESPQLIQIRIKMNLWQNSFKLTIILFISLLLRVLKQKFTAISCYLTINREKAVKPACVNNPEQLQRQITRVAVGGCERNGLPRDSLRLVVLNVQPKGKAATWPNVRHQLSPVSTCPGSGRRLTTNCMPQSGDQDSFHVRKKI